MPGAGCEGRFPCRPHLPESGTARSRLSALPSQSALGLWPVHAPEARFARWTGQRPILPRPAELLILFLAFFMFRFALLLPLFDNLAALFALYGAGIRLGARSL